MIFYGMSDQLEAEKDNYEAAASATSQEVTTAAARAEELEAALKAEKVKSEAAASATSQEVATAAARAEELEAALKAEKIKYEAAASATSQEVATAAAIAEELEAALKAEKVKSEAAELNASVNSHEVETLTTKVKRLEGKLEKEKKEYVGYKDWVARRNIEINSKMHKLETALKAKVDKSEAAASATSEEVATAAAGAKKLEAALKEEIAALKAKVDKSEAAASATSEEVATAAVGAKKLEAALEEEKDKYELASLEATIAPNDTKMPDMELEELDHLRAQVSEMKRNGKDIRHSLPDLDHVPDVLLGKAKKYLRHRRFVDFKELHGERCFSGQ